MKVALYARVSTEDQAKTGLSIPTQLDNLREWANQNGHTIVKEYVDAGVSGKKSVSKRPSLSQFIRDIESGLEVEALVFTKLDRFFRSVKLYYQATALMDAKGIGWKAIQEDYETITSAGRFKVNIMLAVAEAEADRTSERIKVVFKRKIEQGEYIGDHVPLGLSVVDKHLVPNEDADIVRECFRLFRRTNSIYRVRTFLHESGFPYAYATVARLLRKPMYSGQYLGNPDYCPAIIPLDEWEEVQQMLDGRSIRENQTKRVYLFSGLIRCEECGRRMAGAWAAHGKDNYLYRCNGYYIDHKCGNNHHVRESKVESWLLDNIISELKHASAEPQTKQTKKKKTVDKTTITKKLERLKDLYVDGLIDKEMYLADREKLMSQMPEEEPPQKDLNAVEKIVLSGEFRERYNELSRDEKRMLWRSAIGHMTADRNGKIGLYF